jgi:drug/metabolite transporter (DMT)-like permease
MLDFIWPIGLVVMSNVLYHICAKSVPGDINPFASLTITYIVGAISSGILFFILYKDVNFIREYSRVNWAPIVLGFAIVGLEVGYIFAYKAGWQISIASIVQSAFLAVVLIFVGTLLYKEALTWNKLVGAIVCLVGLSIINMR